jgi:hypothetical protein
VSAHRQLKVYIFRYLDKTLLIENRDSRSAGVGLAGRETDSILAIVLAAGLLIAAA